MKHLGTVTLETERLILRRFIPNDLNPMFHNCWSDKDVWKWTNYAPMNSIDDILTLNNIFTDFWFAKYEKDDFYNWAIQLKATHEAIGRIWGMHPNDRIKQVELAYELGCNWWNQGYVTEAVKAVISFFFNEVGLHRIYANHSDKNPASGRVMQKCGMDYEGISREWCVCNAGRFDGVNYSILAKDYLNRNNTNPQPNDFWPAIDKFVSDAKIIIDRPKGTKHPRFNFIYPLDYGYLENTSSMDGSGIDVWRGSVETDLCDAVICTVDLLKKDSEIKLLIGCTEDEKEIAMQFHNGSEFMKSAMIRRTGKC